VYGCIGLDTGGTLIMNCSRCDTKVPKERSELGYTICTKCSVEEKKVGHIIYPHKTGAYIQVVSKSTQSNLNKLDRRGYSRGGGYKHYKDINLSSEPKSKPKRISEDTSSIKLLDYSVVKKMVIDYYEEWGYTRTLEYLRQLNSKGDIALAQRCKLQHIVTDLHLTPTSRNLKRRFNKSIV
jgi:hypothetical protein